MSQTPAVSTGTDLDAWTAKLAEPSGDPGGGAAAAVALAMGGSLISMVGGYSSGPRADEASRRGRQLRAEALRLADADAEVSDGFSAAFDLPEGEERDEAVRRVSLRAARSAAQLGQAASGGVDDLVLLAEIGSPMLVADVVVAASMIRTALVTARAIVAGDLGMLARLGQAPRTDHPALCAALEDLTAAVERVDALIVQLETRLRPEA